jgi:hypothetical protein
MDLKFRKNKLVTDIYSLMLKYNLYIEKEASVFYVTSGI